MWRLGEVELTWCVSTDINYAANANGMLQANGIDTIVPNATLKLTCCDHIRWWDFNIYIIFHIGVIQLNK